MDPNKVYQELRAAGMDWADKQATYRQLDDQSKSILAQITLEAKALPDVSSMAEAKDIALAASLYRDHLRAVAEALREALRAKVDYEARNSLFQARRTQEATERAALGAAP